MFTGYLIFDILKTHFCLLKRVLKIVGKEERYNPEFVGHNDTNEVRFRSEVIDSSRVLGDWHVSSPRPPI